uniref:Serpentine Receptor, class T n=1 Tax=Haemonchus contortus TaxID=6289 RepID=A0A7I4Y0Y0_HAECO
MKFVHPIFGNPEFPLVFPSDQLLKKTPVFYIYYCIECFIMVFTAPLMIKFCYAIDKSALFHRNLIIILKCHYCGFYMLQLVRLIIIFYEIGWLSVRDTIEIPSVFLVVCYASLFFKTSSVAIFVSMLVERFIASHYIDDYEKKSRIWVAIVALLSSCLISTCYTSPLIFGFVGLDKVAMLSIGVCFVFSIVFVRRDRRRLNDFVMKNSFRYELSTRFQLVENLRVLKIIRNASIAYSIWLLPPCTILVLVYRYFLPHTEIGQIVFASFELLMSLSIAGLFTFSVVALCSASKVGQTLNYGKGLQAKVSDQHQDIHGVVTEKYFQLLQSAWT